MIKHNFYHDADFCKLLSMCISHKCPYGVVTMANETFMAENMMNITNNSVIPEEHCVEGECDD